MKELIKFLRLDRQYSNLKKEILPAIDRILSAGKVLQSVEIENLENEVSKNKVPFAVAVNSGTDALIFALNAAGIKHGDRVAVTSLSFIATAASIVHAGGVPVFVDISPDSYLMDMEQVHHLIDKNKINGVVVVHIYGQMLDIRELYEKTQKKGIFLIEDAAQCLGATCHTYHPGNYSDAACISFDPTKVVGAYGSGGMVLTNRQDVYEKVKKLRYHGQQRAQEYEIVGFNSQLHSIQAEILKIKLKHMTEWEKRRRKIAQDYQSQLKKINNIKLPYELSEHKHIYHKFVIQTEERNKLAESLLAEKIETAIHYRLPLFRQNNMQPYFLKEYNSYKVNQIVQKIISLPIYPELTNEEVQYICKKIIEFYL